MYRRRAMSRRSLLAWSLAAIAGLLVAAGITLAASELSSQQIGLSSEPLSAGDELGAPASTRVRAGTDRARRAAAPDTSARGGRARASSGEDRGGRGNGGAGSGGDGSGSSGGSSGGSARSGSTGGGSGSSGGGSSG